MLLKILPCLLGFTTGLQVVHLQETLPGQLALVIQVKKLCDLGARVLVKLYVSHIRMFIFC